MSEFSSGEIGAGTTLFHFTLSLALTQWSFPAALPSQADVYECILAKLADQIRPAVELRQDRICLGGIEADDHA